VDATVASRTANGISWLGADHQGTAMVAIDEVTQQATIRRQTPFGVPRGTQPTSWPNSRGFVGGTNDRTGLTHLGAREYDPAIGRFISVDPVMDLSDPQQWNAYAYSNSNPVTFSDPTGLFWGSVMEALRKAFGQAAGSAASRPGTRKQRSNGYDANDDGKITSGDYAVNIAGCNYNNGYTFGGRGHCAHRDAIQRSGDFVGDFAGVNDYYLCAQGDAGACAWAGGSLVAGVALGGVMGAAFRGVRQLLKQLRRVPPPKKPPVKPSRKDPPRGSGGDRRPEPEGDRNPEPVDAGCKSFGAATAVLMADGTRKPIEKVKVGDKVVATDPATGKSGPRTVTHVWVHNDRLTGLAVEGGTVVTTEDHLFWNATDRQWQRADALSAGDRLAGADGRLPKVGGLRLGPFVPAPAYNLTIDDIHTYYVLAGNTPVLVHNTRPCKAALKEFPDLSHLEGADPEDVLNAIPDHWNVSPMKKAPPGGGIRFTNPNAPGQSIIYETGWPGHPDPVHRGPYLRVNDGAGYADRIPLAGNPEIILREMRSQGLIP
jgi:RHS repeat-associated protein